MQRILFALTISAAVLISTINALTLSLALSIVLVFLVLAAQYETWTSPAAVIAVVPLSAIGASSP